jgi:uncharacterized protein (TIGR00730 family)
MLTRHSIIQCGGSQSNPVFNTDVCSLDTCKAQLVSILNMDAHEKRLISAVMFGGGSVMRDNDIMCQHAWTLSTRLSEMGWCILTGGGQEGIMKWASVGARQGRNGKSVAITCKAVRDKHIQAYGTIKDAYYHSTVCVLDIRDRKQLLLEYSDWRFFFPGSIGTIDELFTCLQMQRTRVHSDPLSKVVFIGALFWTPLINTLRALMEPMNTTQYSKKLLAWNIVDTVEEVMNIINTEYGGPVGSFTPVDSDNVGVPSIIQTTKVSDPSTDTSGADLIQHIIKRVRDVGPPGLMSEHHITSISGDINYHIHGSQEADVLLDIVSRLNDRACCIILRGGISGLTPLLNKEKECESDRRITLSLSPNANSHITNNVINSFVGGGVTDLYVNMNDIVDLKHWHMRNSGWHLFFPGDLDTMDEVFTCLCVNKQRTKSNNEGKDRKDLPVPPMNRIIFVGAAFWQPILSVIKEITTINCKDEANVYCYEWQIVDTADEFMAIYVAGIAASDAPPPVVEVAVKVEIEIEAEAEADVDIYGDGDSDNDDDKNGCIYVCPLPGIEEDSSASPRILHE